MIKQSFIGGLTKNIHRALIRQRKFLWLLPLMLAGKVLAQGYLSAEPRQIYLNPGYAGEQFITQFDVAVLGQFTGEITVTIKLAGSTSGTNITLSPSSHKFTFNAGYKRVEIRGTYPAQTGSFSADISLEAPGLDIPFIGVNLYGSTRENPGGGSGTTWVGVVPETHQCPADTSLITIFMDDEDRNNTSRKEGWVGASSSTSHGNTTYRFCRVRGDLFKALATDNQINKHYAVLKLSSQCPPGAATYLRYYDNENNNNSNWWSSSSGNNGELAPNFRVGNDTALLFCVFTAHANNTMNQFPNLGIQYGVLAAPGFSHATASGYIYSDDQDDTFLNPNDNYTSGDTVNGERIIAPTNKHGRDTTMYIAKVTQETKPVAICHVNPTDGISPLETSFDASHSYARAGKTIVSYDWSFSDTYPDTTGAGPHFRIFYADPDFWITSYTAWLTVTDNHGETASTACSVYVQNPSGCKIKFGPDDAVCQEM